MTRVTVTLYFMILTAALTVSCSEPLPEPGRPESPLISAEARTAFLRVYSGVGLSDGQITSAAEIMNVVVSRAEPQLRAGRTGPAIRDEASTLVTPAEPSGNDTWGFESFTEGLITRSAPSEQYPKGQLNETHKTVHRPSQSFRAGTVSAYTSLSGNDATGPASVREASSRRFKVETDIDYVETLWHQQKSSVKRDGEVTSFSYGYQSSPTLALRVSAGSKLALQKVEDDTLVGKDGWTKKESSLFAVDASGFVTKYRPKAINCDTNARPEQAAQKVVEELADRTKETTTKTTVSTSTEGVGSNREVERLQRTTSTTTTVVEKDKKSSRPLSARIEEHTSTVVTHVGRGEDGGLSAGAIADYVETEREITVMSLEYSQDPAKMSKLTKEHTIWRYTDNPRTRNDVSRWKSAKSTLVRYFQSDPDDDSNEDFTGEEWLVDQIEVDSDVNGKPFAIRGEDRSLESHRFSVFGANLVGKEQVESQKQEFNISLTLGQDTVAYSGEIANSESTLAFGENVSRTVRSGVVGAVTVSAAEQKYVLHPDEFRALQKTAYLGGYGDSRGGAPIPVEQPKMEERKAEEPKKEEAKAEEVPKQEKKAEEAKPAEAAPAR